MRDWRSSEKTKMSLESSPGEYHPCPLQFYDFRQLDHKAHCPVYFTILESPDSGISLDQLDSLHSDLTALQADVQNRIHLLESELSVLNEWQVKRDYRKRKHSDTSDSGHSRPRVGGVVGGPVGVESQPPKRQRLEEHPTTSGRRAKHRGVEGAEKGRPGEQGAAKARGDAADRFWSSVEPYCADITEMDIRMLQEGQEEDLESYYQIPPLGHHYSRRWAEQDLGEEGGEGVPVEGEGRRGAEGWHEQTDSLLKRAEGGEGTEDGVVCYGPLTQRLIAAFLEEPSQERGVSPHPPARRLSPPVNSPQVQTIENRLKEELMALGILEPAESKTEPEEDEIMVELKQKQAELSAVVEYNQQQRKALLTTARAEMNRQEIRKKLQEVDAEVMEWLRRFMANRQKKKSASRKEKEAAWKALEQREALCQRLLPV